MKRRSFLFGLLGAPLAAKTADAHVKIPLRYVDDLPVKYEHTQSSMSVRFTRAHAELQKSICDYIRSDNYLRNLETNNALMKRLTEKG